MKHILVGSRIIETMQEFNSIKTAKTF